MSAFLKVLDIRDVAERQLCCGCGACAYVSPDEIEMVDAPRYGCRPRLKDGVDSGSVSPDAMRVCPGIDLTQHIDRDDRELIPELAAGWGPVRKLWEGHAADPEIRFRGSSGGAATALALYCMEQGGMHGALHIAARADAPHLNHTVLSTTRDELVAATGSRYAPASPCDGLQRVADAPRPCVFIGKPCDVAAAAKARALRPELDEKLGVTIAVFCAGTPATQGTLDMLRVMGVDDPAQLTGLRYRGDGWPGNATATTGRDGEVRTSELTYEQAWGEILQSRRQWRCYLCPDHTGEFADIAVGDPWYRELSADEAGYSLVLARTQRGREVVEAALGAGYLELEPAAPSVLPASQPNLLRARGHVWGRVRALRLMGVPTPRFRGIPTFRVWLRALSVRQKLQSLFGTIRRVFRKRLRHRHPITDEGSRAAATDVAGSAAQRVESVGATNQG